MLDPFSIVRQAHRICAAYYQHIFPLINDVAQKLETTFVYWDTQSFDKPPKGNKNPLEYWKWDFLPIMELSFVFSRQREPGTPMSGDDFVIDFKLVTDSELSHEQRMEQYGEHEEPIATELKVSAEDAKSYLCVYIFSATAIPATYDSPYSLWANYSGYPETDSIVYLSDEDRIKGIGFSLQLSDIAKDNGSDLLVEMINTHLVKLQAYQGEAD